MSQRRHTRAGGVLLNYRDISYSVELRQCRAGVTIQGKKYCGEGEKLEIHYSVEKDLRKKVLRLNNPAIRCMRDSPLRFL